MRRLILRSSNPDPQPQNVNINIYGVTMV